MKFGLFSIFLITMCYSDEIIQLKFLSSCFRALALTFTRSSYKQDSDIMTVSIAPAALVHYRANGSSLVGILLKYL